MLFTENLWATASLSTVKSEQQKVKGKFNTRLQLQCNKDSNKIVFLFNTDNTDENEGKIFQKP